MHVQTNASADSSELLQSYWNADSSSLTVAGPSCHADSSLCYGVRSRLPLSVSRRQLYFELLCPTNSLLASPSASGHGEISSLKPFVWFRAKTDKGIVCLAGHLHSVALLDVFRYLSLTSPGGNTPQGTNYTMDHCFLKPLGNWY